MNTAFHVSKSNRSNNSLFSHTAVAQPAQQISIPAASCLMCRVTGCSLSLWHDPQLNRHNRLYFITEKREIKVVPHHLLVAIQSTPPLCIFPVKAIIFSRFSFGSVIDSTHTQFVQSMFKVFLINYLSLRFHCTNASSKYHHWWADMEKNKELPTKLAFTEGFYTFNLSKIKRMDDLRAMTCMVSKMEENHLFLIIIVIVKNDSPSGWVEYWKSSSSTINILL